MATIVTTERDERISKQQTELRELQRAQQKAANGDKKAIKMVKANRDAKHEIPEHEAHLIHVYVLSRTLSADQQSFNEISRVIVIQPRNFDQMISGGAFTAYQDAKVLHDPRENAPRTYALKPVELKATNPAEDIRAREIALEKEKEDFERQKAQFEARLAALEKGQAPAPTGKVVSNEPGTDLPPLDIEGDQSKTKNAGKESGKK